MYFAEYSGTLYNCIGFGELQSEFVRNLFLAITQTDQQDLILDKPPRYFSRLLTGELQIKALSQKIAGYIDRPQFADYLSTYCTDDVVLNLQNEFAKYDIELSTENFEEDLADVFCDIIMTSMEKKSTPKALALHFAVQRERYSTLKNLLYFNESVPLVNFYIPNDLLLPDGKRKNAARCLLGGTDKRMIISGTGGLGKSVLMRYMTLKLMDEYQHYKKIPIMIQLNEYDSKNLPFVEVVKENTRNLSDLDKHLENGDCVFLLDAMDEIPTGEQKRFEKELLHYVSLYPKNTYIMSSRPISRFIQFQNFKTYELAPFSLDQAVAMVRKVRYHEDTPSLKEKFIWDLQEELYEQHQDFVENPLLLTIMLLTYQFHAHIPKKRHVFFAEAFQTLAKNHDETKEGFDRVFETKMNPREFSMILQEFCARTYLNEKFEFTDEEFYSIYDKLRVIRRIDKQFTADQLLNDLTNNLCILMRDQHKIRFVHRSFQEYFCALHLSREREDLYPDILTFFINHPQRVKYDYTFEMLYDLDESKVERLIYVPFLEELFDKCPDYWDYLEAVYDTLYYNVGDVIDEYENCPQSFVYLVLLREKEILHDKIDDLPLDKRYIETTYLCVSRGTSSRIIASDEWDENEPFVTDVEECGYNCAVPIRKLRNEHSELHDAVEDENFVYKKEYYAVKRILAEMQNCLKRTMSGSVFDTLY